MMITYNYKHTQQKQRLERFFQQELMPVLSEQNIKTVRVNFQLIMDERGCTKEEASVTLRYNERNIFFKSISSRFKKSSLDVILEIKNYFANNKLSHSA